MKIIDLQELKPPYDVASGLAETLIAAGLAKKYQPLEKLKMPQTTWKVTNGLRVEDDIESPIIWYSCGSCGLKGTLSGPTCEQTQKLHHCGSVESVPADVQRAFRVLRIAWEQTHRRSTRNPLFGAPSYGYTLVPAPHGDSAPGVVAKTKQIPFPLNA